MATCVNKNSRDYKYLQLISGLSDFKLSWLCNQFLDQNGRFPYLDELYDADSSSFLKETLNMYDDSCSISTLLDLTGTDNYQSAVQTINNKFRDILVDGTPINTRALLNIRRKAPLNKKTEQRHYLQDNTHDFLIFNNIVNTLQHLYNIDIKAINNNEILRTMPQVTGALESAAFIYNNTIYVNTDIASADAPIHEILHIFIGSMRLTAPDIYFNIISNAEQFSHYDEIAMNYPNRTHSDINEEVFVNELARYIAGMESDIDSLDYEILYNTRYILNNILMGTYNAHAIENPYIYSIRLLSDELDSPLCDFGNSFLLEDARHSRILANKKLLLMEQNELLEICL